MTSSNISSWIIGLLCPIMLYSATWDCQVDYRRQPAIFNHHPAGWRTDEGVKIVHHNLQRATQAYGSWRIPGDAVGLKGVFTYRGKTADGNPESLQLIFNLNRKNGGNGSAGTYRFNLPSSEKLRDFAFEVPFNAHTHSVQVVWKLGGPKGECVLQQFKFYYIKDRVRLTRVPEKFHWRQTPLRWRTSSIRQFYNSGTGQSAQVQTQVKLAYNSKYLYVGFIAEEPQMSKLQNQQTQADSSLWLDDCLELFLFDPDRNSGWQFITNPGGIKYEARLIQPIPGDPFRNDKSWNGAWDNHLTQTPHSWEAALRIPWSSLGFPSFPGKLYLNAARERKYSQEESHLICYRGKFNQVEHFAVLNFTAPDLFLTRSREKELISYTPQRPKKWSPQISATPQNYYSVGAWPTGMFQAGIPAVHLKNISPARWQKWQKELLHAWGQAGMVGPLLPWAANPRNLLTPAVLQEMHQKYGMKYPYALFGSGVRGKAIRQYQPRYYFSAQDNRVDSSDPAYTRAALDILNGLFNQMKDPEFRRMVGFIHGIDEPTNGTTIIFSRIGNPTQQQMLDQVDQEIKQRYGFGQFGLFDRFARSTSKTPYQKIAFWRWWNDKFKKYLAQTTTFIHNSGYNLPHLAYNRNTTAGLSNDDASLLSSYAPWIGCDPYPSSTTTQKGIGRAVYHTGFNVKLLADLAPHSEVCIVPQCFVYYGYKPEAPDLREWASQALKNGARHFYWYVGRNAILYMPEGYNEMLNINRFIARLPRLKLPSKTSTAIWFSEYDMWGLSDSSVHALYTVYALLGEQIGSWFNFCGATLLSQGSKKLSDYQLLLIPRLRYADRKTVRELQKFLNQGGTLVVFDPQFLSSYIDGTPIPERRRYLGTALTARKVKVPRLTYGKKFLPLSKIRDLAVPEADKIDAWNFATVPPDARVLARYSDGSPAIIERSIGRGKIIFSAVMPFGDSQAAIKPQGWRNFLCDILHATGEKTDLPIWNFTLPDDLPRPLKVQFPGRAQ